MNAAELNKQQDERRQQFIAGQYRDRHFKLEKHSTWVGPRPARLAHAPEAHTAEEWERYLELGGLGHVSDE